MEDDIDIYEDLPSFETKYEENYGRTHEGAVVCEHGQLKSEIAELTIKLEKLRKVNENLEVNLSSLLKTAKAEIARKDRMIEDLRRELDDASFRRGTYAKTGTRVVHRHFPRQEQRAIAGEHIDFTPQNSHSKPKYANADSSNDETDERIVQNDSNRVPVTVFGERLRKKIEEERSMEKREKQLGKFTSEGNSHESVEGYVAESDKENSLRRNILDREKQSLAAVREPIMDDVQLHGNTGDRCTVDENDTTLDLWRRSALMTKCNVKRVSDDMGDGIAVKRLKTAKDFDREYVAPHNFTKYEEFRQCGHLSKKQHVSTRPNVEQALDSHHREKHGCLTVAVSKKERSESRERSSFPYDKKGSSGYATRHGASSEKSKAGSDEGSMDDRRYSENSNSFRRDDCRRNNFDYVGWHRTRQRDNYRDKRSTFDNRSRKSTVSDSRYRERKHKSSSRVDRYGMNCSGKEDALYDWKTSDADKLKIPNKEPYVSRNTRNRSVDRKSSTDNTELLESTKNPKDKSRTLNSFKHGTRESRGGNGEETGRSLITERSVARAKPLEKTREETKCKDARKSDKVEQRIERVVHGKRANDLDGDSSSIESKTSTLSTHTEDIKTSGILDSSLTKVGKDDSKNWQSIKMQFSNTITDVESSGALSSKDVIKIEKEEVEASIKFHDRTGHPHGDSPAFSAEERIENIEKFIRGYTSDRESKVDQAIRQKTRNKESVGIPEALNVVWSSIGGADETLSKDDQISRYVNAENESESKVVHIDRCFKFEGLLDGELSVERFSDARFIATTSGPGKQLYSHGADFEKTEIIREGKSVPEVTSDEDSPRTEGRENVCAKKQVHTIENGEQTKESSDPNQPDCAEDERILKNTNATRRADGRECVQVGDTCLSKDESGKDTAEIPYDGSIAMSFEYDGENDRPVEKDKFARKVSVQKNEATLNVHGKVLVVARRRKNPVRLVDNNANMTIVMHPGQAMSSPPNASCHPENSSVLKPRACKNFRIQKNS